MARTAPGSCAVSISSDVDLESTLLQLIVSYGISVSGPVGAENSADAST